MLTSTVCAAVSAAGLGIAAITAYRKRFLAATRIAAFSLIPIGLVMTGVIDWVTGIVFKPTVWAGFGVLALSVVLFMTTRAVERRRGGIGSRKERKAAAADRTDAVAPAASVPSLGAGRAAAQPTAKGKAAPGKGGAPKDDFSDIEAILKKHGI
ncbi:hypothetical protein SLV14_006465 [Streptomyces sp. Je 1-4]|uniref:hypothetical protein n=1 Tax=Streptomyces TaxID=1883 RepID=UPI0021DA3B48|nr:MULTISPECIES: hypothetical protein [unclassified Streptomyces]UYB43484.1 hypothetical protein SLV14_006465 [Streptomyces sp. Je 1-4]UZQ39864.1 hypothetical protein SLV14N_006465 [Streptomyces sp. Je 1-4] [Streptomyces sp. Je 1-4 4N24]UZQ47281.1 hypothetical protein SLV14NA_006465 [Streptomyces sp. Je 1-4] [Streptomyces sp. Je 1-4 4N24_ara]